MIYTEQNYLDALVEGNDEGLNRIYKQFLPPVTRLILAKGGNAADAQDVFQSALLIIFDQARQGNLTIERTFQAYLMKVCRNIWGNRLQKKSFHEVTLPDEVKHTVGTDLVQAIQQQEEEDVFWSAFEKLSEDCRQILTLFFKKEKMEEIGSVMGFKSVSYTKKRKHYCKDKLTTLIREDPRYDELRIR